jgi:hypothetical protein
MEMRNTWLYYNDTQSIALPQACKRWLPGAELAKSPGWLNPLTGRVARILICSESSTQPCDMCKQNRRHDTAFSLAVSTKAIGRAEN